MTEQRVHLVMFDIDGTLVDSTGFDSEFYSAAVRDVLGVDVDRSWRSYRHVTDSGILEEVLIAHAPPARHVELEALVRRSFVERVRRYIAADPAAVREIRGAKRLLDALAATAGVRVAIATGGWRDTALLKLAAIGIDASRLPIATSTDAVARVAIMQLAERRALAGAPARRRTYFGDGAWDQRASAELGYDFVAVGTAVLHPTRFEDLAQLDPILEHLAAAELPIA